MVRQSSLSDTLESDDAVRHIGTNALPLLLKWVAYNPPTWCERARVWYATASQRTRAIRIAGPIVGVWDQNDLKRRLRAAFAADALVQLGPDAAPALPNLLSMVNVPARPDVGVTENVYDGICARGGSDRAVKVLLFLGTNSAPFLSSQTGSQIPEPGKRIASELLRTVRDLYIEGPSTTVKIP